MTAPLKAEKAIPENHVLRRVAGGDKARLLAMYLSFEPKGAAAGLPPRDHDSAQAWVAGLEVHPAVLAEVEGRAVGHAILCPLGDSAEAALFVHQDWRGKGIGRELLTALLAEAQARGLHRVWGIAEPGNISMIRLARKLGFSADGTGAFILDLPAAQETCPGQSECRKEPVVAPGDDRNILEVLRFELQFLEKDGYGRSPRTPRRPQLIFEDSPTCMNYHRKDEPAPCTECILMRFAPLESRTERAPCRHIPLNHAGDTVGSLSRAGTQEELEGALGDWLRSTIAGIEAAAS